MAVKPARIRSLLAKLEGKLPVAEASPASLLLERRASSLACSSSQVSSQNNRSNITWPQSRERTLEHRWLRHLRSSAAQDMEAREEVYAEFTDLQRLLQQYQRNLGAVGKAVTEFTEHLWRRKNASGHDYIARQAQAENDRNELAATEEELVNSIRESSLSELAEVLHSFSSLGQKPDSSLFQAMTDSLDRNLQQPESQPKEILTVLGLLASLGSRPPAELLDRIASSLAFRLDRCSPSNISSLMNSMAAFGRTNFPLMSRIADAVISRKEEFSSEALADLLYSFAILQYDAQEMVDVILQQILFDLKNMSPAALSELVYGLHLLNHRDAVTDVFLEALAEAALGQLHHFTARQLAILAYNYGTLNHWGRNDQELLDAITIRMLHQHHELDAGEVGDLVWSVARANHLSPRTNALLSVVTQRAMHMVDDFSPKKLSRLLHSLSQLSFYNKDLFDRSEAYIHAHMDSFAADDLVHAAISYVRLMHESPTLMPAVLQHLRGRYEELSADSLCGLVWGAAVLGDLTVPLFEKANNLLENKPLKEFTGRDFVRLFQAEMLIKVNLEASQKSPQWSDWLRSYADRSLRDKLYLDRHASNTQQEICRCLMQLGISYTLENVVDNVLAVDMILQLPQHPKVAVKVEPVSKYTSSKPRRALADIVVRRKLLEARSWKLICIAEHEWVRLKGFEDRLAYLEGTLEEALGSRPALQSA